MFGNKNYHPNVASEATYGDTEWVGSLLYTSRDVILNNVEHISLLNLETFMIKASSNVETLLVIFTKNELP